MTFCEKAFRKFKMLKMKEAYIDGIVRHLTKVRSPLIVVVGPTGGGKTALSLEIARTLKRLNLHAEIINADSRQLFRGFDIGTAKATEGERAEIPHHLLGVLSPGERVTAASFKRLAEGAIEEIVSRGNVPMLVGGSMLYVSAVIDNFCFAREPRPELRRELERECERCGSDALYMKLKSLDPEAAKSIDPRNKVYLIRALEICLMSGKLRDAKKRSPSKYDAFIVGVKPKNEELKIRIEKRVDRMFSDGWVEEVEGLLSKGAQPRDAAMESHGYREIAAALKSHFAESVRNDEELKRTIAAKTWQYARRQMTWWRRDERILWLQDDEWRQPSC